MEIKQLKSFVTVAECKSFSRAAQIIFMSQPSISTHISMLEREMGVKLMERTSKSLTLTDEGREFYEYAVSILKLNDKMLGEIGSKSVPCIHIGCSTVPSAYVLPKLLSEYVKNNKGYTFDIFQSDSRKVIDGVLEGIFDVGFSGIACHEKGIESHVIASDEMVLILPDNEYYQSMVKDSFDEEISEDVLKRILVEPFILREEGSGSKEMLKNVLSKYDFAERDINVIARNNDHEAVINMVERGVGVSYVSSLALNGNQKRNVISIRLPEGIGRRDFYMIYKRSAVKKEAIRGFVDKVLSISKGKYIIYGQDSIIRNYTEDIALTAKSIISVVGAGGKSTLIEAIANEYIKKGLDVIITTTTHILRPDGRIVQSASELNDILLSKKREGTKSPEKIYMGVPVDDNGIRKLKAVSDETFKEVLSNISRKNNIPVLIEADGAKGYPCKAPAEYEPVIREETDVVLGVISMDALGGKIKDVCHRPKMVSRLLGKGINDIITDKDLNVLFTDSNGLKKGVTQTMRYVPLMRIG